MKRKPIRFHTIVIAAAALLTSVFAFAALLPVLLLKPAGSAEAKISPDNSYDSSMEGPVLRLHVIANSDSDADQRVKLLVRDAVLAYEREREVLLETRDAAEAEEDLLGDGNGLYEAVETVLEAEGCGYGAQLMLGDFDFPDREYGEKLYPAGNYRALRIILGEGGGHNWWCILFPPLCLVSEAPQNGAPQEAPVRFESLFVNLWRSIFGGDK